ncbi:MAG: hypothetical protein CR986_01430 [Ignavibacteriae bacterium]|nr:MAG: hypothetical protein CR986_01430 [Ignavibacteriota bacterium]
MNKLIKILILCSIGVTLFIILSEISPNLDMRLTQIIEYIIIQKERFLTESFLLMLIISFEVAILIVLSIYWRKEKIVSLVTKNKNIKKNIRAIRNEDLLDVKFKYPNKYRRTLLNKIKYKKLNDETLTKQAKKLSVAKGELFLAARLKQLQEQQR